MKLLRVVMASGRRSLEDLGQSVWQREHPHVIASRALVWVCECEHLKPYFKT